MPVPQTRTSENFNFNHHKFSFDNSKFNFNPRLKNVFCLTIGLSKFKQASTYVEVAMKTKSKTLKDHGPDEKSIFPVPEQHSSQKWRSKFPQTQELKPEIWWDWFGCSSLRFSYVWVKVILNHFHLNITERFRSRYLLVWTTWGVIGPADAGMKMSGSNNTSEPHLDKILIESGSKQPTPEEEVIVNQKLLGMLVQINRCSLLRSCCIEFFPGLIYSTGGNISN